MLEQFFEDKLFQEKLKRLQKHLLIKVVVAWGFLKATFAKLHFIPRNNICNFYIYLLISIHPIQLLRRTLPSVIKFEVDCEKVLLTFLLEIFGS